MCGITGFLDLRSDAAADSVVALAMAVPIVHRRPDDMGAWAEGPVVLAHRRLPILELSPAGHQPMCLDVSGLAAR